MKKPFAIGDRVRVYADSGAFYSVVTGVLGRRVLVDNVMGQSSWFHSKQCRRIKPKKKKVKVERWVNVYSDSTQGSYAYPTYEQAHAFGKHNRQYLATVKLEGSYEV